MGLPPTAELAWRWTDAGAWITKRDADEPSFAPRDVIARVSPVPLCMIQSTKDEYVSKAEVGAVARRARRAQKAGPDRRRAITALPTSVRSSAPHMRGSCLDRRCGTRRDHDASSGAWREHPGVDAASTWIVAHAARAVGCAPLRGVLALSWHTLRGIHTHEVRAILRTSTASAPVAALVTALNIAIMGLYDVIAFAGTRTRPLATMEVRCGRVLLEQLPHAWPAGRSRDSLLAVSTQRERALGAPRRHRLRDHRVSSRAWPDGRAAALIIPRIGGGVPLSRRAWHWCSWCRCAGADARSPSERIGSATRAPDLAHVRDGDRGLAGLAARRGRLRRVSAGDWPEPRRSLDLASAVLLRPGRLASPAWSPAVSAAATRSGSPGCRSIRTSPPQRSARSG